MNYLHEFFVERPDDNGELVELTLRVNCEIELPSRMGYRSYAGRAQIDGTVFEVRDDGSEVVPWNGSLTKEEIQGVEQDAYEAYTESCEGPDPSDYKEDETVLFDEDFFHDERALVVGGRKVYY